MNVSSTLLVIGGCRSGKSRHALELARAIPAARRYFVATCIPRDAEMQDRVARHQAERDPSWQTVEAPLRLSETLERIGGDGRVVVVDCLTLWMSNLMMESRDPSTVEAHVRDLTAALARVAGTVILVSNEVGAGIVPENSLARRYRDLAGFANQRVAACADRVIWMLAGIPVTIKPQPPRP